eukprot:TRINITY_DN319_c0_g2_i3.p1 TRINITY_DN319_c0_g2~~TRINITY_DN319_c0_g2_i3.p1  ORF type:complete len:193 (-),score=14.77 TRINITY_DN319_c0_g2_i3:92-670(-)
MATAKEARVYNKERKHMLRRESSFGGTMKVGARTQERHPPRPFKDIESKRRSQPKTVVSLLSENERTPSPAGPGFQHLARVFQRLQLAAHTQRREGAELSEGCRAPWGLPSLSCALLQAYDVAKLWWGESTPPLPVPARCQLCLQPLQLVDKSRVGVDERPPLSDVGKGRGERDAVAPHQVSDHNGGAPGNA